ncbi:hypothetical protein [Planktothricoides sp. SR001]|uniref:hypothetical protein n=1 Tax=Planktothricoides sp. SR001 TaxID=1705388 RepID=UPI0012E0EDAB|nr:hypothetical protein [Planktothricoides sp. SR001]
MKNLMTIFIKIAGTKRGYLILKFGDKSYVKLDNWKIEAIGEVPGDEQTAILNN